jgi:hypothetical protein
LSSLAKEHTKRTWSVARVGIAVLIGAGWLLAGACSGGGGPEEPDLGSIENGIYRNQFFRFSLLVPAEWDVADEDTEAVMWDAGHVAVSQEDPAVSSAVDGAMERSYQLLTLTRFRPDTVREFNPNLLMTAERITHLPGVRNGSDYLAHTARLLLGSPLGYSLVRPAEPRVVGGREFYRAEFRLDTSPMTIEQVHYATLHRSYALTIVLSGATPADIDRLEEIVGAIMFD